jgi:hypothetical protein
MARFFGLPSHKGGKKHFHNLFSRLQTLVNDLIKPARMGTKAAIG